MTYCAIQEAESALLDETMSLQSWINCVAESTLDALSVMMFLARHRGTDHVRANTSNSLTSGEDGYFKIATCAGRRSSHTVPRYKDWILNCAEILALDKLFPMQGVGYHARSLPIVCFRVVTVRGLRLEIYIS